jgi:hypothetical protein
VVLFDQLYQNLVAVHNLGQVWGVGLLTLLAKARRFPAHPLSQALDGLQIEVMSVHLRIHIDRTAQAPWHNEVDLAEESAVVDVEDSVPCHLK